MVQAPSWWVEDFNWSSHSEPGKAIKERDLHSCSHLLVLWLQVCKIVPLRDSITKLLHNLWGWPWKVIQSRYTTGWSLPLCLLHVWTNDWCSWGFFCPYISEFYLEEITQKTSCDSLSTLPWGRMVLVFMGTHMLPALVFAISADLVFLFTTCPPHQVTEDGREWDLPCSEGDSPRRWIEW